MSLEQSVTDLVNEARALLDWGSDSKSELADAIARIEAAAATSSKIVYVDAINGNDEALGTSIAPLLTLDKAIEVTSGYSRAVVYLLSNVTLSSLIWTEARLLVLSGVTSTGAPATRTLQFASEASNSPAADGSRRVASIRPTANAVLVMENINFIIPNCGAVINDPLCIRSAAGLGAILRNGSISVADVATTARMFSARSPTPFSLWVDNVSLGTGVPGKLIDEFAAGMDPNAAISNRFRSNLTSV